MNRVEGRNTIRAGEFYRDLIGIATIFILAVIFTNPLGDFPLNDDWAFGITVERLLEKGRYEPYGWAGMPLISNVILGWIFSLPRGFSFEAVRLSTLTVSLIGLCFFYWLILKITNSRWLGICSTLMLAFGPIYFALSHTFMTDVPFTASLIISAYYLWKYLQHRINLDLYVGTIFSLISILSRQLGLAVPIAFAITMIWLDYRRGHISSKGLFNACLPAIAAFSTLKLFEAWLRAEGILSALYEYKTNEMLENLTNPSKIIVLFASNSFYLLCYAGLLLLPILLIAAYKLNKLHRYKFSIWVIAGLGIMVAAWQYRIKSLYSALMPFSRNVLDPSGIGPLTLRDTYLMERLNNIPLPSIVWLGITLMSIAGGSLLLGFVGFRLYSYFRPAHTQTQETGSMMLFWTASLIYISPLFLATLYDRYLVPIVPLVTAAILSQPELVGAFRTTKPKIIYAFSSALVLSFAVFSVSSTHDYLAWNRARWLAIDSLSQDRPALASRIDGGFEFNGLYGYDPRYKPPAEMSWWWVKSDERIISFGPIKGWKVIKTFPYPHLLPSKNGAIYVLEKIERS